MQITIWPHTFKVEDRYYSGDTLSDFTANYLNTLRANGLRELFKSRVKGVASLEGLKALQQELSELDSSYTLPKIPKSRAPWTFEDECKSVALEFAQSESRRCAKPIDWREFKDHPDVIFLARRRFEAKSQTIAASLDSLLA